MRDNWGIKFVPKILSSVWRQTWKTDYGKGFIMKQRGFGYEEAKNR